MKKFFKFFFMDTIKSGILNIIKTWNLGHFSFFIKFSVTNITSITLMYIFDNWSMRSMFTISSHKINSEYWIQIDFLRIKNTLNEIKMILLCFEKYTFFVWIFIHLWIIFSQFWIKKKQIISIEKKIFFIKGMNNLRIFFSYTPHPMLVSPSTKCVF